MSKKNSVTRNPNAVSGHATMSRIAWTSFVLSLGSQATAFQYPLGKPSLAGRVMVRSGSDNRMNVAQTSPSGRSLFSISLKYANEPMTTEASTAWWSSIFQSRKVDEQQNVDEYLEFLERRYNRLHSSEEGSDAMPMSALSWLLNGSPKRNDVRAAAQQEEDALHVLGVAGLASERLLHKHHLLLPNETTSRKNTERTLTTTAEIIDVVPVKETQSTQLIKKVLGPVIRKYAIFQKAKDTFVDVQLQRVRAFAVAVLKTISKSLIQAPGTAAKAFVDLGGGKRNIMVTISALSAMLLVLRPIILQAAISESSAARAISP